MREIDNLSSIWVNEGFCEGIQTLIPKAFRHFTILMPGLIPGQDVAVGGLHKEESDAKNIRGTILRKVAQYKTAAAGWEKSFIKYIPEDTRFTHWTPGGYQSFIHGHDDGTHDSELKNPEARRALRGFVIP